MADKHIHGKWQMRHRQNRPIAGIRKYRNNSIWTMFPKVISKRVDFLPTHNPQVALFPTFAWNLRSWCWWSVPSLFSIDQSLAEIQPLNQYFSTSLSSQPYNFWTKINKKNLFSKFCSAKSKNHLSQFWKNWINFQGGVAKRLNTVLVIMAATVMPGFLISVIECDQHEETNQVY